MYKITTIPQKKSNVSEGQYGRVVEIECASGYYPEVLALALKKGLLTPEEAQSVLIASEYSTRPWYGGTETVTKVVIAGFPKVEVSL